MTWETQAIALLAASLVRPFVLAAVAWLILRVFGVRHPASQHMVWTSVLAGMLLLPFVSIAAPHWNLPVIPARHKSAPPALVPKPANLPAADRLDSDAPRTAHTPVQAIGWPSVETLAIRFYLAGLFAMVTWRLIGSMLLWRVLSRSRPLRARWLRESDDVLTPVVVGVLRPVVILPSGWRDWNAKTKRAVLAHEFAHLRRRDPLVSSLAWWVKCLYWFHPVFWRVSRTISDWAEGACDAVALERLGDPAEYSRMLLRFADAVNQARRRVVLPGLAISSRSGMDRRIGLVFEISDGKMRKLTRPGLLLALGVPVACLAATVGLGEMRPSRQDSVVPVAAVERAPAIPAPSQPPARQVDAQLSAPPLAMAQPAVISASPFETPAGTPSFELVSVKPCSVGERRYNGNGARPGLLEMNCNTVADLIRSAYVTFANGRSADTSQRLRVETSGAPAWVDSDRFTIQARAADINPDYPTMAGPMLQALLEDRFQLKVHRETRDVPVYALTVASGGLKMQPFQEGSCVPVDPAGGPMAPDVNYCRSRGMTRGSVVTVDAQGMSIGEICDFYLRWLNRPVIDKTGLTGRFDFRLVYARAFMPSGDGPSGPSIVAAMQEQLGLELQPDHAPFQVVVVDSVNLPTGN